MAFDDTPLRVGEIEVISKSNPNTWIKNQSNQNYPKQNKSNQIKIWNYVYIYIYTHVRKKKLNIKYMTELFPFIDWVKKYIFEKLKITWLFVLVTNYPKKKKKQTKIRPRSTYPKTLNLKAKL